LSEKGEVDGFNLLTSPSRLDIQYNYQQKDLGGLAAAVALASLRLNNNRSIYWPEILKLMLGRFKG